MSVWIRGMKMPESCDYCPWWDMKYGMEICRLAEDTVDNRIIGASRPSWCPLIEVPPHGRLIDADAMNEKYGDWYTEEGTEEGFIGTLKYLIAEQPIIIEEEAEE